MKIQKIIFFLLLVIGLIACGGNIVEELQPSFSAPIITSINPFSQNGTQRVKIEWYFPVFEEPIIKGFKLEKSENNGAFKEVSLEINPNQRNIELAETFRGGKVIFKISTIGDKNSQTSQEVSYFAPNIVSNTFCTSLSTTILQTVGDKPNVYLNWSLNPNSATYRGSFQVLKTNQNAPTAVVIGTTNNLNFIDDKVEFDNTYLYSVRMTSNNCLSNAVPISTVKIPNGLCPSSFSTKIISENNTKSVILNWDAQLSNFSSFTIKKSTQANGNFVVLKENLQSTVFQDKTEFTQNTTYYYKIVGFVNSQPPNTCESGILEVKF